MSMDLYVWKAPLVSSEDEANELLEGDPDGFEPSADVLRFYAPGAEGDPCRRGVVVGGWVVPIPVLDWIAIGIGAFVVLMALYSVVVWLRE